MFSNFSLLFFGLNSFYKFVGVMNLVYAICFISLFYWNYISCCFVGIALVVVLFRCVVYIVATFFNFSKKNII